MWKPHCGRPQTCAKEPLALWTLFIWVVMWGRFTRRRALRRSEDLTGLHSFCACHAFLSKCPVFDHACCLPPVRQTGRLAICCVSIPPWVGIAGSAFSNRWCGYRISWVHFGLVRFFMAIPTENERDGGMRRTEGTENGVGGAAEERFCASISALRRFPRGVRWGKRWKPHCGRAPDCAKETCLPGFSSFGA